MDLHLDYTHTEIKNAEIQISGSKSESNRLLILQQWFKNIQLENCSDSDDSKHLVHALNTSDPIIDIGHAGTAMRFLTAYFAVNANREIILTGSERMQNRPIKILVDALKALGADIEYVEKEGYPPLRIVGKKLRKDKVAIQGNVSSQYISALLLIAPYLERGLEIELLGEITSRPYLEMTTTLLEQIGVAVQWNENSIRIFPQEEIKDRKLVIESDWSSASYFYSLIALSEPGAQIRLSAFKANSLQGDSVLATLYENFGVATQFDAHSIILKRKEHQIEEHLTFNLVSAPDIAQTIAVTCFALGSSCELTGLHTLKIKETDRLVALQNELRKLGADIEVTNDKLYLKQSKNINSNVSIATYHDHRMAMAFAPLALKVPITIEDTGVVTKSYIRFWEDLEACMR